jgi:hypothetical protein
MRIFSNSQKLHFQTTREESLAKTKQKNPVEDLICSAASRALFSACVNCKNVHIKCNGVKPLKPGKAVEPCHRCYSRRMQCIWSSRKGKHDKPRTKLRTHIKEKSPLSTSLISQTQPKTSSETFPITPNPLATQMLDPLLFAPAVSHTRKPRDLKRGSAPCPPFDQGHITNQENLVDTSWIDKVFD